MFKADLSQNLDADHSNLHFTSQLSVKTHHDLSWKLLNSILWSLSFSSIFFSSETICLIKIILSSHPSSVES